MAQVNFRNWIREIGPRCDFWMRSAGGNGYRGKSMHVQNAQVVRYVIRGPAEILVWRYCCWRYVWHTIITTSLAPCAYYDCFAQVNYLHHPAMQS